MVMRAFSPVEFAEMAVTATNDSIIVLDLYNSGSTSRWQEHFPSLTPEQLNMLDGVSFLHFNSPVEAIRTFERLTFDCTETGSGDIVGGTITLVISSFDENGVEMHAWDLHETSRPVCTDRVWSREDIVARL